MQDQEVTKEQEFLLKDGRSIFKTHNGFKYYVQSRKGEIIEVTESYYKQAFQNRIK